MNEREFTKQVIDLAHLHGWWSVHFLPATVREGRKITPYLGDGKGFPDIVAVRERMLFAELKIPPNKPTPEQLAWARGLTEAGQEIYLWTPADLEDIKNVFARRV